MLLKPWPVAKVRSGDTFALHSQVCKSVCEREVVMATNLAIDERLLVEALKAGGLKTKKATVNEALREFIQRRKQLEILERFGSVEFEPGYDHKKGRSRR